MDQATAEGVATAIRVIGLSGIVLKFVQESKLVPLMSGKVW